MTIKQGERCPGRFLFASPEMAGWFEGYEAARAFPGSFSLDDTDARTAEAMIQIQGRAPLKDPVAIKIKDFVLTLRNDEASHIMVEVDTDDL
jgi:hypothetical protein